MSADPAITQAMIGDLIEAAAVLFESLINSGMTATAASAALGRILANSVGPTAVAIVLDRKLKELETAETMRLG